MAVDYVERLTFEDEEGQLQEYNIHDARVNKLRIPTKVSELDNDAGYLIDKDYVHTDNNYTTIEKQIVATVKDKVDKVEGKGLSTNDLTDELLEAIGGSAGTSHTHQNKELLDQINAPYTLEVAEQIEASANKLDKMYKGFGVDLEKPKMLIKNPNAEYQKTNLDWENIQVSTSTDYSNMSSNAIKVADTSGASTTIKKSNISIVGKTETPGIVISKVNSELKAELTPNNLTLTNLFGETLTINADTGVEKAEKALQDGNGNNIANTYSTKQELQNALDGMEGSASAITNKINSFNHNCFYRGADITSYLTDNSLWDRIAGINGYTEFEDLYLGDYIILENNITANESTKEGTNKVIIAGFKLYKYIEGNHLVMLPDTDFGAAAMGASSSGYKGTNLHQEILNGASASISSQLETIFTTHLKSYSTKLVNSLNNSGLPESTEDTTLKTILLNEIEITGSRIWGANGHNIGNENIKLPIFNFISPFGNSYWLRDIITEDNYCNTSYNGEISSKIATEKSGIKAKFIIG